MARKWAGMRPAGCRKVGRPDPGRFCRRWSASVRPARNWCWSAAGFLVGEFVDEGPAPTAPMHQQVLQVLQPFEMDGKLALAPPVCSRTSRREKR